MAALLIGPLVRSGCDLGRGKCPLPPYPMIVVAISATIAATELLFARSFRLAAAAMLPAVLVAILSVHGTLAGERFHRCRWIPYRCWPPGSPWSR